MPGTEMILKKLESPILLTPPHYTQGSVTYTFSDRAGEW